MNIKPGQKFKFLGSGSYYLMILIIKEESQVKNTWIFTNGMNEDERYLQDPSYYEYISESRKSRLQMIMEERDE